MNNKNLVHANETLDLAKVHGYEAELVVNPKGFEKGIYVKISLNDREVYPDEIYAELGLMGDYKNKKTFVKIENEAKNE
jgi:hypothetical protein